MLREIVSFLKFYPGMKLQDVIEMHSVTFFALLAEGYRQYFGEKRMQATIATVPHMENGDRTRFIRELDTASTDPRDIFNTADDDYSGIETLKQLMG